MRLAARWASSAPGPLVAARRWCESHAGVYVAGSNHAKAAWTGKPSDDRLDRRSVARCASPSVRGTLTPWP